MNNNNKVDIIQCDSFDQAQSQAVQEAANSNGSVYPVVLFRQGDRDTLTGAMAVQQISKYINLVNKSKKGGSPNDVITGKNRPIYGGSC